MLLPFMLHILSCVSHRRIYILLFAYIHIYSCCYSIVLAYRLTFSHSKHTNICVHPNTEKISFFKACGKLSALMRSCLLNIFWRICASCHSPLIRFLTCKNMRHVVEISFYFFPPQSFFWFLNRFLLLLFFVGFLPSHS